MNIIDLEKVFEQAHLIYEDQKEKLEKNKHEIAKRIFNLIEQVHKKTKYPNLIEKITGIHYTRSLKAKEIYIEIISLASHLASIIGSNDPKNVYDYCIDLGKRKNADYGGTIDNIAMGGAHGIAVRLLDKGTRIHNLSREGRERQVKDESLLDTSVDIVNYAAFGVMLIEGTWAKEDGAKKL